MDSTEFLAEECECAAQAVERAFAGYADLCEDIRMIQQQSYNKNNNQQPALDPQQFFFASSEHYTTRLMTLRKSLDALMRH